MAVTLCELTPDQHRAAYRSLPAPLREAWFDPAYNATCARWENAAAQCLRVDAAGGFMLYPFLAHAIEDTFDVQTAYGYGGPVFAGEWGIEDKSRAIALCSERLREQGAVAEFVRCHTEWCDVPALAAAGFTVFQVRTNVECDLAGADFTTTWAASARRNLRKAQSAGLRFEISTDTSAFAALYGQTAERLGMSASYRFDRAFVDALCALEQARLILVTDGAAPVAAAVVLIGGRLAFYHLGGSDFARQHLRPNDMLYYAMASAARDAGCARIVWGGGLSNDPADTLFRFKSHFGAIQTPVFCAGRILDQTKFAQLHDRWRERTPGREAKLFLKYRS